MNPIFFFFPDMLNHHTHSLLIPSASLSSTGRFRSWIERYTLLGLPLLLAASCWKKKPSIQQQREMKSRQSSGGSAGSKMERKDVEKNRRLHMKGLCLKLSSLIPKDHRYSKDVGTQLDHLDGAAEYIKQLKDRIEELKQRRGGSQWHSEGATNTVSAASINMPVIEVRYHDGTLDVALISKLGKPFKLHEVISVLEQEGAEVINASFSVIGDKIFYTIHSQALSSRIGLEASRVSERLQDLI